MSPTTVHTDFENAFREGLVFLDNDQARYVTSLARLGMLHINSGGVAIGDIFSSGLRRARPPRGVIEPGAYPVELSLITADSDGGPYARGDVYIAVARITFSDKPVTRWVEADTDMDIDSGTCGISDADVEHFELPAGEASEDLMRSLKTAAFGPESFATRHTVGDRVVCACTAGFGEGTYSAYWGMSAAGEPVMLCLDFEMLTTTTTTDIELPGVLKRGAIRDEVLDAGGVKVFVPFFSPGTLTIECTANTFAVARWKTKEGTYLRVKSAERLTARRQRLDLKSQPEGTTLVIRVLKDDRPMTPLH